MSISTPSCNFVTKILVGFKLDHPVKRRVTRPQCQPVGSSPGFLENQKPEHFRKKIESIGWRQKLVFIIFDNSQIFRFFESKIFFASRQIWRQNVRPHLPGREFFPQLPVGVSPSLRPRNQDFPRFDRSRRRLCFSKLQLRFD